MLLTRRFTALNGAAIAVGLLAGLSAVFFRASIDFIETLAFQGEVSFDAREHNAFFLSPLEWAVVLVPAAGGLLVGFIRRNWPDTRQQGVSEVMAAVQTKGGIMTARSSLGHAIISAITVGSGGSTGREGPIGYIGAALGSSFGRRIGFRTRDIRILVGAGFAAGIAVTFNTPLGGVLLALELVVPEFSTHAFIPLVVATGAGMVVGSLFIESEPTFDIDTFAFGSAWELVPYLFLGVVCGAASAGFIHSMGYMQRFWAFLPMQEWARPGLGGLVVGFLGLLSLEMTGQYHVFGTGYATVTAILEGNEAVLTLGVLLALIILKPLATSTTIASGGGGGVFSASLYQGALYGGVVGLGVAWLWPGLGVHPASFALVGMAAFYAAAARATLTAIVMMAELVNDFHVVLPVMLTAVTADAVSIALSRDSIYTVRLAEKGIHYEHDRVQHPMHFLQVREVMTKDVANLRASMTLAEAFERMLEVGHTGFPVVDDNGRLSGVVTRRDLSKAIQAGRGEDPLSAVVPGLAITCYPDEMLHAARTRMYEQGIGRLVVVDRNDRTRVVGILTRSDLLRAEAEKDIQHGDTLAGARP